MKHINVIDPSWP